MDVSAKQIAATAGEEGIVLKAYKDGVIGGVQKYTIGVGHQIQPNESYLLTGTITRAKALALFKSDSKNVVDFINANTRNRRPNQNQFDAFFDYGYNCGLGGLQTSVLKLWNAGASYAEVAEAIRTTRRTSAGVYLKVLEDRRAAEAAKFVTPYIGGLVSLLLIGAYAYLYWCTSHLDGLVKSVKDTTDDVVHMFV